MTYQSSRTIKLLPKNNKRSKLSVRGRFFTTMITLIVLIESLSGFIFHRHLSNWLYQETLDQSIIATESIAQQLSQELVSQTDLAVPLEAIGPQLAKQLTWLSHIAKSSDSRLSLVSLKGKLLLDTSLASIETIQSDPHQQMPEIHDALQHRIGISRRYSKIMMQDSIYVASAIKDEKGQVIALIRLAKSSSVLDQQLDHLGQVLLDL